MDFYNMIGRRITVPERPLEPPDCWQEEQPEPEEAIRIKKTEEDYE